MCQTVSLGRRRQRSVKWLLPHKAHSDGGGTALSKMRQGKERQPARLRGGKVRCSVFMLNSEGSRGRNLGVLWKHGLQRKKQWEDQENLFVGDEPEAELIAWMRIS